MSTEPNLREIADRIGAHLSRFEADPEINPVDPVKGPEHFFHAGAYHGGPYVMVRYISYQGATSLRKPEALAYLAWLDAGNVGRHFEQQRELLK